MSYADCFVAPVAHSRRADYAAFSRAAGEIYRAHGALDLIELWGEDIPPGQITSFPLAVQCREGEAVTVSLILWPSRAARDAGNAKVMEDPRMHALALPFDGKRAIMGGFEDLFSR
jgi:uncharacterized protein YbaA (DUF1428 family)